ncbi:MAG: L,D-transpeptidase [Gammaproteobacteria bacterium]|nr:L,D-transpeptidase [Gammaproteobacteria bacterium]MDD9875164.1 L,D-transpeptidase [Gammaproteobacteria bacterium]
MNPGGARIRIDIPGQTLTLLGDPDGPGTDAGAGAEVARYRISSAAAGVGEINGSYRTPRGRHLIRAKIGGGAPLGSVFVARRLSGEIFTTKMREAAPQRDWILTRILWLSGCQPGFNRLGTVDSMRRYIYIHGAPDDVEMGRPGSRGCIRMRNRDVADLFERVAVGTPVDIHG